MRKSDIETYCEHGRCVPAINVKLWRGKGTYPEMDSDDIAEHFGCSPKTAEQAGEFWYESACEQFWEQMPECASEIFPRCKVYSAGRSGGWLTVHNLPEVESWDAIMIGKWSKLCKIARAEIAYFCSREYMLSMIEASGWAEDELTEARKLGLATLEDNQNAYL